eukprot:TRINITY_DN2807_c0_g1_i4.p1 TRINITY_DN2807_c0_g1~~TRINITY_DN2807_c0_g1_i4.p1  ORF type:complete len:133 (-),score=14.95 TRINITY_DN2807_c0_g1_i4:19-372(-)
MSSSFSHQHLFSMAGFQETRGEIQEPKSGMRRGITTLPLLAVKQIEEERLRIRNLRLHHFLPQISGQSEAQMESEVKKEEQGIEEKEEEKKAEMKRKKDLETKQRRGDTQRPLSLPF